MKLEIVQSICAPHPEYARPHAKEQGQPREDRERTTSDRSAISLRPGAQHGIIVPPSHPVAAASSRTPDIDRASREGRSRTWDTARLWRVVAAATPTGTTRSEARRTAARAARRVRAAH